MYMGSTLRVDELIATIKEKFIHLMQLFFAKWDELLYWIAPRIMHFFRTCLHYISFALHLHFA